MIDCVVAPFDHEYADPSLAVSVTLPPEQNVVGPVAVIVATGCGFTAIVTGCDVTLQPAELVAVTTSVTVDVPGLA